MFYYEKKIIYSTRRSSECYINTIFEGWLTGHFKFCTPRFITLSRLLRSEGTKQGVKRPSLLSTSLLLSLLCFLLNDVQYVMQ